MDLPSSERDSEGNEDFEEIEANEDDVHFALIS